MYVQVTIQRDLCRVVSPWSPQYSRAHTISTSLSDSPSILVTNACESGAAAAGSEGPSAYLAPIVSGIGVDGGAKEGGGCDGGPSNHRARMDHRDGWLLAATLTVIIWPPAMVRPAPLIETRSAPWTMHIDEGPVSGEGSLETSIASLLRPVGDIFRVSEEEHVHPTD
jgi:hypothetical protein